MTNWNRWLAIGSGGLLLAGVIGCSATTPGTTGPGVSSPNPGGTPSALVSLQGRWRLVSLQDAGSASRPAPAGSFAAEFRADGQLSLVADCNLCSGTYTAGASSLEVKPVMACTVAACPSAPFDTQYVAAVIASKTWSVSAAGALELRSDRGVTSFTR
jgi:heat shock protein HslJ